MNKVAISPEFIYKKVEQPKFLPKTQQQRERIQGMLRRSTRRIGRAEMGIGVGGTEDRPGAWSSREAHRAALLNLMDPGPAGSGPESLRRAEDLMGGQHTRPKVNPLTKRASAFLAGLSEGLEKKADTRIRTRGSKDLFEAKGPTGETRAWVSYIPGIAEKHMFHQPDVRTNIAGVIRALRKDPGSGSISLENEVGKERPLTTEQGITALRRRGKFFSRGPAGKMGFEVLRLGKK